MRHVGKTAGRGGWHTLAAALEEWLESFGILHKNQGRSQAPPLAASATANKPYCALVALTKSSRERGCASPAAALEEWLEALGILRKNQGRSQAASLAAGRQRTRCRDRPQPQRTSRILRDS